VVALSCVMPVAVFAGPTVGSATGAPGAVVCEGTLEKKTA
jgi:hypothetical protein